MKIGKVEEGVPIPEINSKIKHPWPDMDVGDSVLIQPDEGQILNTLNLKVSPSVRYYGEKSGKKFKTQLNRDAYGGRVWRMK